MAGIEQLPAELLEKLRQDRFAALVGISFDAIDGDRVHAHLDVRPRHRGLDGSVHGGVYATVAQATASVGCAAHLHGAGCSGISNVVSIVRYFGDGRLAIAATSVDTDGDHHQLWDVRISEAATRELVAQATVAFSDEIGALEE